MPRVELVGGFYEDSALQFNAQNCINMYPEYSTVDSGKGSGKLKDVHGLIEVKLREIDADYIKVIDFNASSVGTPMYVVAYRKGTVWGLSFESPLFLGFGTHSLSKAFTDNIKSIKMVDNGYVTCVVVTDYISTEVIFFTDVSVGPGLIIHTVTDPDLPSDIIGVTYKDSYFVWLTRGLSGFEPSKIYISSSFATNYTDCVNALDFTTVEINPDESVAIETIGDEVVVFGSKSIQYFYNSGNVDFPLESNKGVTQNIGASSAFSIEKIANRLFFLGSDESGASIVYTLNGYSPERISTHAIEKKINDATILNEESQIDINSYSYQMNGHYFYCLTIPALNTTLCYDITSGLWHERVMNYLTNILAYPVSKCCYAKGKNFVVYENDYNLTKKLIRMSYFDDDSKMLPRNDGETTTAQYNIKRTRTLQHLSIENRDVLYKSFELDIQKGVANVDDPDPTISISMSKDGGMTYGTAKVVRIGGTNTKQRIRIKRLGRGRDIVFKIESSSPVQQEWFTAYVEYEALND